jgi:O-antigen/teichoic acid export membrane protein
MRLRFKIAANTAVQLIGRGVSAVSSLIITILIARHFGVEAYGDFIKITTFVALFYLAADFGLNAITVKELGEESKESQQDFGEPFGPELTAEGLSRVAGTLRTLFSTRILLGMLLTWLAIAATVFLPFSPETREGFSKLVKLGIIIFAPTIFFQSIIRSSNAFFQHKLRYDKSAIAVSIGSVLSLALVAGIVIFKLKSIILVVAALVAASATTALVAYILFQRLSRLTTVFVFNIADSLSLLKKSLPLGLTLLLNIAFFRLDIFLLAIFRSTTEVGLYGLAYKFFELPLIFSTFFMNAIYPVMANYELRITNYEKYKNIIKHSSVFLIISSLILTVVLWTLAPYITLIKSDFAGSVVLFRLLILWLPLFYLSSLFMWVEIAQERLWGLVRVYSAGLIANFALNILLIPKFGSTAAAYTTGATELFILALLIKNLRTS